MLRYRPNLLSTRHHTVHGGKSIVSHNGEMAKNTDDYKVNGSECESIPLNESSNEDGKEECQKKPSIQEYRSFLQEILHNDATRFKTVLSVCAASGFCMLGWTKGQLGPAFLDILLICGTSLEEGSIFMTSYFIGRVMGSILGGAIYSRLNRYLILVVALTTNSLMFAVIPWCTLYELMIAAHVLHGISGGVMSVSLISIAASIWGTSARGRVYMNIFYAAFAISGFLSPIVTSPFLIPTTTDVTRYNTSWNTSNNIVDEVNGNSSYIQSAPQLNATHIESPKSRLYIAFSISAGFAFLVTIPFVVIFFKSPQQSEKKVTIDELHFIGNLPILIKILQFVNVGIFSAVFVAMDFSFSGFLTVFCVQHLKWTKTAGSLLTSVAFVALLSGRIFGAVLTNFLKPVPMLLLSIMFCIVGFVGLSVSAIFLADVGIWISVCIIGAPLGVVWPSFLSWINENLIPLRGKVTAYLMITAFVGALLSPMLFGYMMEEVSPIWFCFLSLGKAIVTIINVTFFSLYTRFLHK